MATKDRIPDLVQIYNKLVSIYIDGPLNSGHSDDPLDFLRVAGIYGFDVGLNVHETGKQFRTGNAEFAIRIHVRGKKPKDVMTNEQALYDRLEGAGTPVTIKEAGFPFFNIVHSLATQMGLSPIARMDDVDVVKIQPDLQEKRKTQPPIAQRMFAKKIQPGISVGHKNRNAGTLGSIVYKNNKPMILSAWHVLAHSGAKHGDRIMQPGISDGGIPERDCIATLYKPQNPGRWGEGALAEIKDSRHLNPRFQNGMRNPAQLGLVDPSKTFISLIDEYQITLEDLGQTVSKSGKATGVTHGVIDGVGVCTMDYLISPSSSRSEPKRTRIAMESFRVTAIPEHMRSIREEAERKVGKIVGDPMEISKPGDSGSIWFICKNDMWFGAGLHIEGEKNHTHKREQAFACHLPAVRDKLKFIYTPPKINPHIGPGVTHDQNGANRCPSCGEPIKV